MLYKTTLLFTSILVAALLQACQPAAQVPQTTSENNAAPSASSAELAGIKNYLLDQAAELQNSTAQLQKSADEYYTLAEQNQFDYAALWQNHAAEVTEIVDAARAAWMEASPLYEKMEGIVAGTPALAEFDVILDAGASAADDPENAVPFDLTLPNGQVLAKPGNLFGVTESTLWGTYADYTAADVTADFNGNGAVDFGESLPDANVLKAGADALHSYASDLIAAAQTWSPTPSEAFTALVVMIPTMNEYFGSWRDSRFVAGEQSTQRDFVAISRLADMQDILGGLEVVYAQVQPLADAVDSEQSAQIATGLSNLRDFVSDIYRQEQDGKRFSAEEADLLGAEAQNRATNVTGQISQVAAQLNISIAD